MLSLIPALLILAFHGPAAVERMGHEGKLPEALRALERVWAPKESEGEGEGEGRNPTLEKQRQAFLSLTRLTSDPEFSRAVSQLFGLTIEVAEVVDPDTGWSGRLELPSASPGWKLPRESARKGFMACRRPRDGPPA